MPLIIVTGLPCSGKSTVAKKIRDYFLEHLSGNSKETVKAAGSSRSKKQKKQVKLVTDGRRLNSEGRYTIYQHSNREKELRGWLKTEASRYVNQGHIVILDAACYIKGFRYELFCLSKEAKTQYCIVECHPKVEECWARNERHCERQAERCYEEDPQEEDESEQEEDHKGGKSAGKNANEVNDEKDSTGYDKTTFDALVQRYEKCNDKDRWDSPLFSVTDTEAKDLDIKGIFEFITKSQPLIPNKSTAPPTSQPLNFFQELESTTTKVIDAILKSQKLTGTPTGSVTVPGTDKKYSYNRIISSGELGRFKRQFIAYTRLHPVQDGSNITELFIQYLNSVIN